MIGAAFTALVNALVNDFLSPLINIPLRQDTDFAQRYWNLGGAHFKYGDFVNKLARAWSSSVLRSTTSSSFR